MSSSELRTHPDFDTSELTSAEELIYTRLQDRHDDGDVPDEYILQWVESYSFSFAREDALPVPENESNGAAVEVEHNPEKDDYWVTLYHEDGPSGMGVLKGFGTASRVETINNAIDAACEAMRLDDQLATADWEEIDETTDSDGP